MNKTIIAITFGAIAIAATAALAQPPCRGNGPGFQQTDANAFQPGPGFGRGPGRMRGDPAQRIDYRVSFLTTKLDLNEEQQTQIKAALEEQHAKRVSLREETHNRISAVLNQEQQTKFEQLRSSMGKGRRGGAGMGNGPGYAPAAPAQN